MCCKTTEGGGTVWYRADGGGAQCCPTLLPFHGMPLRIPRQGCLAAATIRGKFHGARGKKQQPLIRRLAAGATRGRGQWSPRAGQRLPDVPRRPAQLSGD